MAVPPIAKNQGMPFNENIKTKHYPSRCKQANDQRNDCRQRGSEACVSFVAHGMCFS